MRSRFRGADADRPIERIEAKLDQILTIMTGIMQMNGEDKEINVIMEKLEAAKSKRAGYKVLLKEMRKAKDDPEKLQKIAQAIDEAEADWQAAFEANTEDEDQEPAPVTVSVAPTPLKPGEIVYDAAGKLVGGPVAEPVEAEAVVQEEAPVEEVEDDQAQAEVAQDAGEPEEVEAQDEEEQKGE